MNKSYRIIWNKARNCLMVVAEFASSQGKGKSAGAAVVGAVAAAVVSLGVVPGGVGDASAQVITTQKVLTTGENYLIGVGTSFNGMSVSGASAVVASGVAAGSVTVYGYGAYGEPVGISVTNGGALAGVSISPWATTIPTLQGSQTGIRVANGSSITGVISNTGIISGVSGSGVAVIDNSTLVGGLVNNNLSGTSIGTISGKTGISVLNSNITGNGISIAGNALVKGTSLSGISLSGSYVSIINNQGGTITGQTAIRVVAGSTLGGLSNTGAIVDSSNANTGLLLSNSAIAGNVFNSGFVFGRTSFRLNNAAISGAITNTGAIDNLGVPSPGYALVLTNSTLSGGLNNASGALIRSGATAIGFINSGLAGNFNNAGTIDAPNGTAVYANASTLSGINNLSGGVVMGLTGIRLVNSQVTAGLTNAGVIAASSGQAVTVSGNTLSLNNLQTGTIIGAVNGQLNVVNSGLIALQSTSGPGSTSTVTGSHVNASISGNYVQASTGTLQVGVTGSGVGTGTTSGNYSVLNVAGSASFSAGSNLRVNLAPGNLVTVGQTIVGVVNATGGLTSSGFTVTDNLAGVNFTYSTTSGALSLVAIASTINCGATVSAATLGTCEVAINNPNLYVNTTGSIGTLTGTINGMGVTVLSGNIAGRIYNQGTIVGQSQAILFTSGATLTGGITNAGVIRGVTGSAITMAPSILSGGLTNQSGATIAGLYTGIALNQASIGGGVNNRGLISGGAAILLSGATITGGINNSIGGVITASGIAVQVINGAIGNGINNSGKIIGDYAAISASGDMVTLTNQQYALVQGALLGTLNVSNSGVIALQSTNSMSGIAGNFVQSPSGALIFAVSSNSVGGYSNISVGGTASLASSSSVKLRLASSGAVSSGQTVSNLIVAGALTASGVGVVGNSAQLNFSVVTTSGALSVVAAQRAAASYGNTVSGAQTVTSYVAFDNTSLTVSGAGATISGVNQGVVVLSAGPTPVGGITNAGRIAASNTGIYFSSGATANGGLFNTGQVIGASVAGLYLDSAALTASGTASSALRLSGGTFSGGLYGVLADHSVITSQNTASGINVDNSLIAGGNTGIALLGSTVTAGMSNYGSIVGASAAGMLLSASLFNGSVFNQNVISGGAAGLALRSGSSLIGGLTSTGLITAGTNAGNVGLQISNSLVSGDINLTERVPCTAPSRVLRVSH